jgi:hypothetical protein
MKLLAIRLSWQSTPAKSLVIIRAVKSIIASMVAAAGLNIAGSALAAEFLVISIPDRNTINPTRSW